MHCHALTTATQADQALVTMRKKRQQDELTGETEHKERGQLSELASVQYPVLQHFDTSVDLLCMKAFIRMLAFC